MGESQLRLYQRDYHDGINLGFFLINNIKK